MRSYDMDGVITAGVVPTKPCIILSGRVVEGLADTVAQLAQLGVDPTIPVYLRPFGSPADRDAAGHWKAAVIQVAGIEEHFEDDLIQARIIMEKCPRTAVRLIGAGWQIAIPSARI